MKLNNNNRKDFYKKIINACKIGDNDFVHSVINSDIATQITAATSRKMLIRASGYGHIDIVKDIFSSQHLKKHINYPDILKNAFRLSFQYGHIDVIKFLIPQLDIIGAFHIGLISTGITDAVTTGKIEIIKAFLEDFPIKTTINKQELIGKIINMGCVYNQLNIVKYALEKDNFQYLSAETNNLNNLFATCLTNSSMDVLQYFIFDLNIEKTPSMQGILQTNLEDNFEKVSNWFKIRGINNSLQKELLSNQNSNSIKKPKL